MRKVSVGWVIFVLMLAIPGYLTIKPARAQLNGTVQSGQQAVTQTATILSGTGAGTICIKALAGNSINVYLGGAGVTTSTGMELAAGNAYCAPTAHANQFYVIASLTGASVSWIISN